MTHSSDAWWITANVILCENDCQNLNLAHHDASVTSNSGNPPEKNMHQTSFDVNTQPGIKIKQFGCHVREGNIESFAVS